MMVINGIREGRAGSSEDGEPPGMLIFGLVNSTSSMRSSSSGTTIGAVETTTTGAAPRAGGCREGGGGGCGGIVGGVIDVGCVGSIEVPAILSTREPAVPSAPSDVFGSVGRLSSGGTGAGDASLASKSSETTDGRATTFATDDSPPDDTA